ncbi:phytase [Oxalobacteraceae bacterium]|nr:phytase [Oxalobacteraceae bacterium]
MAALCSTALACAIPAGGAETVTSPSIAAVRSQEHTALPDGGTLTLDKQGLHLLDAAGKERAKLPMRAKHLDTRSHPDGALALVVDANTDRAMLVVADVKAGQLRAQQPLPAPAYGIEAACLFRDAQQLDHLFQIGKDGQAEQWLLYQGAHRLERRLALPPHVKHCQVDDASQTLLIKESGIGLWAYSADAEGPGGRTLHPDDDAKSGQGQAPAWKPQPASAPVTAIIMPRAQTEPMARLGDAADDPAIWVNPANAAGSRVLGTNKKQGLLVYDLQGKQLQLLEVGRLNNVDLRQNVMLERQRFDLAVATQRDDNTLMLFSIAANGTVKEAGSFATPLEHIYGLCLYQPIGGGLEAFVNDKDGSFLHYRIERREHRFSATLLRRFKVDSQPEGCVADDARARLFLGEEKRGVWTTSADAAKPDALAMVLPVGPQLTADVEGMAIYHGKQADYLVVSSQGSNSYVVTDARPPYAVRGSFRVGINAAAGIDGSSETDGLDVSSANLGGAYARGMLVVQDGYKRLPDGPQNFKYIAWDDIAQALHLP